MNIEENIKRIREKINEAEAACGRTPGSVKLVAASKTMPAEAVRRAVCAGADAVGENRVQEMTDKYALGAYEGSELHFIGHLQKNKVSKVTGLCDLIHSADSAELVTLIAKRAAEMGVIQNILIEVNIGREDSKSGVLPEEAGELVHFAMNQNSLNVKGLMAIPPASTKFGVNYVYFEQMYKLFIDIKAKKYNNKDISVLSMGMSGDFFDAVLSGSNMVRIGSAIFGERNYNGAFR